MIVAMRPLVTDMDRVVSVSVSSIMRELSACAIARAIVVRIPLADELSVDRPSAEMVRT